VRPSIQVEEVLSIVRETTEWDEVYKNLSRDAIVAIAVLEYGRFLLLEIKGNLPAAKKALAKFGFAVAALCIHIYDNPTESDVFTYAKNDISARQRVIWYHHLGQSICKTTTIDKPEKYEAFSYLLHHQRSAMYPYQALVRWGKLAIEHYYDSIEDLVIALKEAY
jgi:hypothetical protein